MAASRKIAALPRRAASPVDEARAAYERGAFRRTLEILEDAREQRRDDRVAGAILRARSLLALNRPADAIAILEPLNGLRTAEERSRTAALRGAALTRTHRRAEGEALLGEANALARRGAPHIVPEIAYYRALSRWNAYATEEAEAIVEEALPAASDVVRARLLHMLGWIDVRRENYAAAARAFVDALEALDAARGDDAGVRASTLHGLAIIAAETIDVRLGRTVRSSSGRMAWTDDMRFERAAILGYLAWLSLLEGDRETAWDLRQLVLTLTVDSSRHAHALVAAATVCAIVGDHFAERRYLAIAGSLLLRGDQVELDVEQRMAMLAFSASVPAVNVAAARDVLTLYERTRPRNNAMLALEGDRRIAALESFARGRLLLAEGSMRDGVRGMQQALEIWTRLGYRLRAAIAANALHRATGEGRYVEVALDALRNAPNAWLRESLVSRTTLDDPLGQLTPAERRVLTELCTGKRAREIADTFGRSFNTINNQTRRIFSVFGVRSRAALVAKCARLGILEDVRSTP